MTTHKTDPFAGERRTKIMRSIRSSDTRPEIAIRKALHAAGFRYRLHVKALPGTPDIVLPKYKAIVEFRGCFWHGHSCSEGHLPQTNSDYWKQKIERTKSRDVETMRKQKSLGYSVRIVWGCEIRGEHDFSRTIDRICRWLKTAKKA